MAQTCAALGDLERARELLETREWRTVLEARRLLDYELGLADWYADRVLIALAVPDVADAARDDLLARGARWKRHSLLLLGSNLLLVAFGAALLATRVRFLRALFAGADGEPIHFEIDRWLKHCLVNGLDEIALTMQKAEPIAGHEAKLAAERPWV